MPPTGSADGFGPRDDPTGEARGSSRFTPGNGSPVPERPSWPYRTRRRCARHPGGMDAVVAPGAENYREPEPAANPVSEFFHDRVAKLLRNEHDNAVTSDFSCRSRRNAAEMGRVSPPAWRPRRASS